jgi:hypothetical protein
MNKIELCNKIKADIVNLNHNEMEEIFKIIYNNKSTYTKNNNGIFINLNWLDDTTLNNVNNYINFCIKSHDEINKYEDICSILNDSINCKDKCEEIIDTNILIDKTGNTSSIIKQRMSSSMKFYLLKKKFYKQHSLNNYLLENNLSHESYLSI